MKTIRITKKQAEILRKGLENIDNDFYSLSEKFDFVPPITPCYKGVEFITEVDEFFADKQQFGEVEVSINIPYIEIEVDSDISDFIDYLGGVLAYIYKVIDKPYFTKKDLWRDGIKSNGFSDTQVQIRNGRCEKNYTFIMPLLLQPEWFYPIEVLVDGCRLINEGKNPDLEDDFEDLLTTNEKEDKLLYSLIEDER